MKIKLPYIAGASLLIVSILTCSFATPSVSAHAARGKILTSARETPSSDDEIYVMNANGSHKTKLTNNADGDYDPAFSSDGTKITFSSYRNNEYGIYVMNSDGTNEMRLGAHQGEKPSFSPDGSKIAFAGFGWDNRAVFVMNSDGTNVTRLTSGVNEYAPSWSPDGTKIAYQADVSESGVYQIHVMNADGSNQTQITTGTKSKRGPVWSPNGTKIAYAAFANKIRRIYIMNSDGSNSRAITDTSDYRTNPTWSPKGDRIAYQKGSFDIYSIKINGTNEKRLTNASTDGMFGYFAPHWR